MWALSPAAERERKRSHTALARVDVLHSGKPVYTLEVVDGAVSTEADRPVMRNLSCTVTDPTGALTGGDLEDLLNPYECEIAPWRGVRVPSRREAGVSTTLTAGFGLQPFGVSGFGGSVTTTTSTLEWTEELAPLGVFGLTSRKVSGDGSISLTGQDRAMRYQGPMSDGLAIGGGTPVEVAVIRLLATRNPGITLLTLRTGFTCGPLLYPPDIDVWREAQLLAASVGGRLFHDRRGQAVFSLTGPTSRTPVATWADGDGLLLGVDRQEDSDTIRNVIVAESVDGRIRTVVEDSDPSSATYARGRYGRRPTTITNQHFTSVQQAQQAAASRLAYELGRSETVSFSAVPHPGLDVEDVITVHRPRAGLHYRGLIVASVSLPLAADQPMTVGCRRSVLAPDGQVFEADRTAA